MVNLFANELKVASNWCSSTECFSELFNVYSAQQINFVEPKMSFVSFDRNGIFPVLRPIRFVLAEWIWSIVGQVVPSTHKHTKSMSFCLKRRTKTKKNYQVYGLLSIIFRIMEVPRRKTYSKQTLILSFCTCRRRWMRMKNTCAEKHYSLNHETVFHFSCCVLLSHIAHCTHFQSNLIRFEQKTIQQFSKFRYYNGTNNSSQIHFMINHRFPSSHLRVRGKGQSLVWSL